MTQTRPQKNTPPLVWGLLAGFLVAAAITAYLTFVVVRDAVSNWSATRLDGLPVGQGQVVPTAADVSGDLTPVAPNVPLQSESGPAPQPWDGAQRVTVLVMGYDYGDWSEDRSCPCRTDTMILLTLDPLTQSAGMLSIPRDLWVQIPGFADYYKINTAYYLGDANQLPDGGPGLAIETVEQLLGVPINFYATIDFGAFEVFVDEIGGVEVDVPYEIDVTPRYGHITPLQPGKQILDGPMALAYARNRYTEGGDFDRAQRTQQVIMAIRDKILSLEMLPVLISKAGILYSELSSGVKTNMTLEQVIQLAWTAQQILPSNIHRGVIAPPYQVILGTSPDGLDILIPVPDEIRKVRDEIFTTTGPISPIVATADLKTLMKDEGARVSVLNGSGAEGLAGKTQEFLISNEVNANTVGNAGQPYARTTIISYTGKIYTIKYLLQVMGLPDNTPIYDSYDPNSQVDIEIMIGEDWAASNPMP
jgi:LCP family protein required for cell wall assembly